jgi:phosphate transport system substrate-binding protein
MRFPFHFSGAGGVSSILCRVICAASLSALAIDARAAGSGGVVHADGAASVAVAIADAVHALRLEQGMEIDIAGSRGSTGGIQAVGEGDLDVGLSSRLVATEDRAACPDVPLEAAYIGHQVIALTVSKDVYDGGVRALSPDQVRAIYEGRVTNWKQLGGPDGEIKFFNPSPGRGVWEVFAEWVYGDNRRAPAGKSEQVKTNDEARNMVDFVAGSLTVLPPSLLKGSTARPLALAGKGGAPVEPSPENIVSGKYSMARPMVLVTNGRPIGTVKILVDFIVGERGQEMLRKQGCLTIKEIRDAGGEKFVTGN